MSFLFAPFNALATYALTANTRRSVYGYPPPCSSSPSSFSASAPPPPLLLLCLNTIPPPTSSFVIYRLNADTSSKPTSTPSRSATACSSLLRSSSWKRTISVSPCAIRCTRHCTAATPHCSSVCDISRRAMRSGAELSPHRPLLFLVTELQKAMPVFAFVSYTILSQMFLLLL